MIQQHNPQPVSVQHLLLITARSIYCHLYHYIAITNIIKQEGLIDNYFYYGKIITGVIITTSCTGIQAGHLFQILSLPFLSGHWGELFHFPLPFLSTSHTLFSPFLFLVNYFLPYLWIFVYINHPFYTSL